MFRSILLLFIISLFINGCTKLDEDVFSSVQEANFYKNESEFISAMVPVYSNMRALTDWQKWWDMEESTDICFTPVKANWAWFDGGIYIRLHQHTWVPEDPHYNDIWLQLFAGVNSTNRVLYQIENSTIDMLGKDKFISELKLARAFYYYLLIENFGNVPIIDRFDVPEDYLPETKSRVDVFKFIETDILENMDNLEDKSVSSYGRFNKWNSRLLLARLYLNAEKWIDTDMYKECEAICDEIIDSGKYSLDEDYSMPFSVSNSLSNETMFVIPFDETRTPNNQIYMLARKTLHIAQIRTFNLVNTWLDGGCVGVPSFFDNYIEGDKRLEKTWRMGQQYSIEGAPLWTDGWVDGINQPLVYTRTVSAIDGPATMVEGYRFGKYEVGIGSSAAPNNDYVIMRYAEVLMTKAECILRNNEDENEAANIVNYVRSRSFDSPNPLTGAELKATIVYNGVPVKYGRLLQELGVEFALEGLRRSQLIRFDDNFTKGYWSFHEPSNNQNKNLFPIPFAQLQSNSKLVPNP